MPISIVVICPKRDQLNVAYAQAIRAWLDAGGGDPSKVDDSAVIKANLKVSSSVQTLQEHRRKHGC